MPRFADLSAFAALLAVTTPALGCARTPAPGTAVPTPSAMGAQVQWADWSAETFAGAAADNRLLLINVVAEWCHWCHVMEETTYENPEVAALLAEHFVTIKVDSDARPDVAERYRAWGWPATGILSPQAEPVLELRGFQKPAAFAALLRSLVADRDAGTLARRRPPKPTASPAAADTALVEIRDRTIAQLDHYYEPERGGWGDLQKYPFPAPLEHAMVRTTLRANEDWSSRVATTLRGEEHLIDPVWGGMYQYSLRHDWKHPHYEKIATIQAGAISNFAMAERMSGEPRWRTGAHAVLGYMRSMMRRDDGGFFTSQDADVRDGHRIAVVGLDYYAKDDAGRRALGVPRVDDNVYADNNGLMILALTELYRTTGDPEVLDDARRAAAAVLEHNRAREGAFTHGAAPPGNDVEPLLYLRDQASMGRGLLGLYRVTGDREYRALARQTADFMLAELADPAGGFFAQTVDPAATGSLAERRKPIEENAIAARFLLELHRYLDGDGTGSTPYGPAAVAALRAVGGEAGVAERGRIVGQFVMALEEATMPTFDITVVGTSEAPMTSRLLAAATALWAPRGIVELSPPGERYPDTGKPAVFLCTTSACSSPVRTPDALPGRVAAFVAANLP